MKTGFAVAAAALAAVAAGAVLTVTPAVADPGTTPGGPNGNVLVTFAPWDFPESLAVDRDGNFLVTLGFVGRVVKLAPTGVELQSWTIPTGDGLLTGVVLGPDGTPYVADATFAVDPAPGVFRLEPSGAATRVLDLPATTFPNGLAFHAGSLYVSDSHGSIWRGVPSTPAAAAEQWLTSPLLQPTKGLGPNGIAFRDGSLTVAVADAGRIVRFPVDTPGEPTVVAEDSQLRTADGIAFDAAGDLFVTVNVGNRLVRVSPSGAIERVANRPDALAYPTMPAFGRTAATSTTLFVANGALFMAGMPAVLPSIVAIDVGTAGQTPL